MYDDEYVENSGSSSGASGEEENEVAANSSATPPFEPLKQNKTVAHMTPNSHPQQSSLPEIGTLMNFNQLSVACENELNRMQQKRAAAVPTNLVFQGRSTGGGFRRMGDVVVSQNYVNNQLVPSNQQGGVQRQNIVQQQQQTNAQKQINQQQPNRDNSPQQRTTMKGQSMPIAKNIVQTPGVKVDAVERVKKNEEHKSNKEEMHHSSTMAGQKTNQMTNPQGSKSKPKEDPSKVTKTVGKKTITQKSGQTSIQQDQTILKKNVQPKNAQSLLQGEQTDSTRNSSSLTGSTSDSFETTDTSKGNEEKDESNDNVTIIEDITEHSLYKRMYSLLFIFDFIHQKLVRI